MKGDKIQEIVVSTFLLHTPRVLVLNSYLSIHCPLPATHIIQRLMHMPSFALFSCPIQAVSGVGNAFECTVVLFGECLLHVSTFATTRVALPTGVEPG